MEGYIKLFRQLTEWEWYKNQNTKDLFIHCLLKANYEEKVWQGKIIEVGSFVTSIDNLSTELGLTAKKIRLALNNLKRTNEIVTKATNKNTTIYIQNWANYQAALNENDKQKTNEQTNKGQTKDKQRATTKELKEVKEDKEVKEVLKDIVGKPLDEFIKIPLKLFIKPTLKDVEEYCLERNNKVDAETFWNFYESKGWKVGNQPMKDWKAAVRTWEKKDRENLNNNFGKLKKPDVKIDWLIDYTEKDLR